MQVITMVYEFEKYTTKFEDWAKLLSQSVFSEEKLKEKINQAKIRTGEFLDRGLYLYKVSVYVHEGYNFTYKKSKRIF